MNFKIEVAKVEHIHFADEISDIISVSTKDGTGLALRTPTYLKDKMIESKAVIAFCDEEIAGFCYIEFWENRSFIANSGLIVTKKYRACGLATKIKEFVFYYSRTQFPNAKIFGLTTNSTVMKINSGLGYKPVIYSDLTNDKGFWQGCSSCSNFDILQRTLRRRCLCTAMLFDPGNFNIEDKYEFNMQSELVNQAF